MHVTAPPDLRLAEIRAIMESVRRHTDGHLHLGNRHGREFTAVRSLDPRLAAPEVSTYRRATRRADEPAAHGTRVAPVPPSPSRRVSPNPPCREIFQLFDNEPLCGGEGCAKKAPKPEQKTLSPRSRGARSFEKSEPTIIGGEDLDVPTFLRQKIKLR